MRQHVNLKSVCYLQFDLVCDHDIYPTIGLAALNAGGPVGVYLFGLINDRYYIIEIFSYYTFN